MSRPQVQEILAPVGSLESFEAALASGADAVYFGLSEGFNARARAKAFELAVLPERVRAAHRAGVKVYLTVNTLVFEDELAEVERVLRAVIAAGVDALIVQDPAVALLAHALCPALSLHASTQMTISSVEGARFAQTLGCTRVVLPRELSLAEIAKFTAGSSLEAEVFVHGALCMAWSGQCLTSEAFSERSANRGQCSQACRMPYDLIVDGERRDLGDTRYLLSPQDLAAQELIPQLMAAGVRCFKIEGRYKNAAYVMSAVDALRHARERSLLAQSSHEPDAQTQRERLLDSVRTRLTFSRGASLGFLLGDDHQTLVQGRTPKHRGIALGRVRSVNRQRVRVALDAEAAQLIELLDRELPRPGMGVMFDVGDPERDDAPGGTIYTLRYVSSASGATRVAARESFASANALDLELSFGPQGPDLSRVQVGVQVFLNGDPEIAREAERRSRDPDRAGRVGVYMRVSGVEGQPLRVVAQAQFAERALRAQTESSTLLSPARGAGISSALLQEKLAALGGTSFQLAELDMSELAPGLHVPVSELKALRRQLLTQLETDLLTYVRNTDDTADATAALRARVAPDLPALDGPARIVPLCRTAEQLQAVIACGVTPGDEVELDFMELVGLRQAAECARAAGLAVTIATVRVQKPGEESYDRRIDALAPHAVLVRHWGALMHFSHTERGTSAARTPAVHGDFSLNVTNSLSARHVLSLGLQTLTASYDLDRAQLLALLAAVPRGRVAVTVHHHMPTFHNSHCVYAHLLSEGRDYRSCGRPCEKHRVMLRDFAGLEHPVIVDVSCRNTVFNARAQSAAPLIPELIERGVRRLRVEFVWETAEEVTRTLTAYRQLLQNQMSPKDVMRQASVHEQYGVSVLGIDRLNPRENYNFTQNR